MCFSATASFTASAVLGILGTISLMRCRTKKARMLAAVPFIFSFQQFAEGIAWLSTMGIVSTTIGIQAASLYIFFAFVLWPIWIPLALLRYEGINRPAGVAIACMGIIGIIMGIKQMYNIFTYPIAIEFDCCHILYKDFSSFVQFKFAAWIYLLITAAPFLYSNRKSLRYLGIALIIAYLFTAYVWEYAFTSVWCFFVAIISGYIAFIADKL
jgi:hypothetical protein